MIALIVLAVLMTSPVKEQRPLTIEDLTDPLLQPNIIQPKWTCTTPCHTTFDTAATATAATSTTTLTHTTART